MALIAADQQTLVQLRAALEEANASYRTAETNSHGLQGELQAAWQSDRAAGTYRNNHDNWIAALNHAGAVLRVVGDDVNQYTATTDQNEADGQSNAARFTAPSWT